MSRAQTDPTIPSDQEAKQAREAIRVLCEQRDAAGTMRVQIVSSDRHVTTLDLPASAMRLLEQMLQELAAGHAVAVVPIEADITSQQAAELLNVSRPYVVGLIDKGVLPARMVGNQRRLPLRDVLAYKAETKAKAYEGLAEMAAIDQELGLR